MFTSGTCTELPALVNGAISYDPEQPSPQKFLRTVAIYKCNAGYSLPAYESTKRVCQQSGQWSGSAPTCIGNTIAIFLSGYYIVNKPGVDLGRISAWKGTTNYTYIAYDNNKATANFKHNHSRKLASCHF